MRYFLDTEFNGFGGELISMALIREDGASRYFVLSEDEDRAMHAEPWVAENVIPIIHDCPVQPTELPRDMWGHEIAHFLRGDTEIIVTSDWPDDIRYFCQAIITGPGEMVNLPGISFQMFRVDAYPTAVEGAVQHNAWWDAMALRALFLKGRCAIAA
jgi:hypothetical protein